MGLRGWISGGIIRGMFNIINSNNNSSSTNSSTNTNNTSSSIICPLRRPL